MLTQVFRAGGIRSLTVVVVNGRAWVSYLAGDGSKGCVHTKAGHVKYYRIETALKFVRQLGVESVTVDMTCWTGSQASLEV
ncbi:hypothetical protein G3O06_44795 [Burkholderia sp. Ac-20345]|uniref:hypothetical protein n=1 Tax=Burkholderia sp. Ac-20345 TaxID=2703891 RepID=UPI00197BDC92|nr:hypothetical protein [Burkholderia sp. Ac-20345]MBN3784579.1 hypothetical protein [Burkholderia sp. Ac-20345]